MNAETGCTRKDLGGLGLCCPFRQPESNGDTNQGYLPKIISLPFWIIILDRHSCVLCVHVSEETQQSVAGYLNCVS